MHMYCSAWSFVPPCEFRLIRGWWLVLFAMRKDCVRVNCVFGTQNSEGISVPCVCFIDLSLRGPPYMFLYNFV